MSLITNSEYDNSIVFETVLLKNSAANIVTGGVSFSEEKHQLLLLLYWAKVFSVNAE